MGTFLKIKLNTAIKAVTSKHKSITVLPGFYDNSSSDDVDMFGVIFRLLHFISK